MFDKGKDLDWFFLFIIVMLGIIVLIVFVYFVVWELNNDYLVVDLCLFGWCNFVGGIIVIFIGYGVFFGNLVILL